MDNLGRRLTCAGAAIALLCVGVGALHLLTNSSSLAQPFGAEVTAFTLGPTLFTYATIALLVLMLGVAGYLVLSVRPAWQGDVEQLKEMIRLIAKPGKNIIADRICDKRLRGCAHVLADVSQTIRRQQDRLNKDAMRDPLTGLPNRRTIIYTLAHEAAFAQRTGWPLSLVMVDIDHFKRLNDTLGHPAGDFVLERTARRLASLVRQSDVVARFGGEEFVVILPGSDMDQAMKVAEELRSALHCDSLIFEGHEIRVTASFGVAELHACAAQDVESLINLADQALYAAKEAGRDRVRSAPVGVSEERAAGLTRIEKEVRQQPVIGTGEGELGESLDQDTMALMGSMFSLLQVIPDHHRVGRDIAQQVAAALRCSEVLLFVLNEAEGHLSLLASAHAVDHTPSQAGASTELESWFSELRSNHRFFPSRAVEPFIIEPQHANGATLVRLPMVAFGQVSGVLEANCNCGQPPLSRRERTVLSALGVIGATALKNCDLYERLESRWMGLIAALCRTIHSYDAYKLDHAERVSRFAVEIARVMGQCDADELQLIRVAGLVHDIGKVGLPPRLFEKRGRLRTSERKLLQQHCHIGADLLDSIPQMEQLAEIVRRHHEHYDGGGYPDGLAGHEIPIESRIIAVADAYDAMTSRRPFRPAFSHDEAVRRIRAASGTQFDPAVATVFVELFGGDMGRALLLNADGLGHLDLVMRSAILAGSAPMAP